MLFALWVYMLPELERGRAVIYVDCGVTPGRFGYAIATLIDSTSSCFSVYRKSSIRSQPLIQAYSIRGRTLLTTTAAVKHQNTFGIIKGPYISPEFFFSYN